MRKHKYKIMLLTTIVFGMIMIPLYIISFAYGNGDFFAWIIQRIAMIITLAFIVLIIYMGRHRALMAAEFNNTAEVTLTYIERRTIETPEVFEKSIDVPHDCADSGIKSIDADEYNIPLDYLYRLFIVDSDSANYTTFVALDIRDGKPYRLVKKTTTLNIYGADFHTKPIDYDEVRRLALRCRKDTDYSKLNESEWESFIPEDKRFKGEEKVDNRVDISSAKSSANGKLSTFFFERRIERKLHEIVYLRKTDKGVRLFGAQASDGVIGLRFEFDFTEQMITDALNGKYGNLLYACDRPVSEKELAFINSLYETQSAEEPSIMTGCLCYAVADGKIDSEITEQKLNLEQILLQLARYGSK